MLFYTYDYCINLMEVRQIDFSTNGVHIKDNEAIIPAFCMEFRPGLNGTSPGSKITKNQFLFEGGGTSKHKQNHSSVARKQGFAKIKKSASRQAFWLDFRTFLEHFLGLFVIF